MDQRIQTRRQNLVLIYEKEKKMNLPPKRFCFAEKAVEHEGDGDNNYNWCTCNSNQRLGKETGGFENQRPSRPEHC